MKRKMKRYAEGSEDAVGFEDVGDVDIKAPEDKVNEDDLSFKDRFSMARDAGDKVFTWRGKKYTTELAGSKEPKRTANLAPRKSNAPAPKPYAPRAFEGGRQLRDFLERDRMEKAERNKGAAERFGEFIRNTRMVGGAPSWTKTKPGMKKGGSVSSSASKRADGIAQRGKTRGRMI